MVCRTFVGIFSSPLLGDGGEVLVFFDDFDEGLSLFDEVEGVYNEYAMDQEIIS